MHCIVYCYHYIYTVYVIHKPVAREANWYCKLEDVKLMFSEESEYCSATDAEFAELIWGGLSQAGAEVSPRQGHKNLVMTASPDRHCTFPQEL